MKTLAESFLTKEEQEQISSCVQEQEKITSGEIVPMIVSASHSYPLAPITGGTLFALPFSLVLTRLLGDAFWIGPDNMWLFLSLFVVLFTAAYQAIKRSLALKRHFLLPDRAASEVREAAVSAFFTEKLYQTKAANGILLYISVLERRVWILADSGINEKIDTNRWQGIVDQVTTGIRKNRSCEAICEAISEIGTILKEHFPIETDDKDELHNLIIR